MAEVWGEYLDTEWYRDQVVVEVPEDPWTADPWRGQTKFGPMFLVPRDLLHSIAQTERVSWCMDHDHDQLMLVQKDIAERGIEEPLELVIDASGRLILRDGHHRLMATGWHPHFNLLPCYFTHSDRIRASGAQPIGLLLTDLLARSVPA